MTALWAFQPVQDPLGHAVYVARIQPDAARPDVEMSFSCGGIVGVVLQFNLGEVSYAGGTYSPTEPDWEDLRFIFAEGPYDTTAKRAPITDGIGTYEIKGSDAAFIAGLLQAGGVVEIRRYDVATAFPLDGAGTAIGSVLEACPYKYPG